jgi:hypothetical protein
VLGSSRGESSWDAATRGHARMLEELIDEETSLIG